MRTGSGTLQALRCCSRAWIFVAFLALLLGIPTAATAASDPPGPELCGDGIDNDEDGETDEGFENLGQVCNLYSTQGSPVSETDCTSEIGPDKVGCCVTASVYVCSADKLSLVCKIPVANQDGFGLHSWQAEGPYLSATCYDNKDNNCNGATDTDGEISPLRPPDPNCTGPEVCNGIDDDGDGLVDEDFLFNGSPIGAACTNGTGVCQAAGVVACNAAGTAATCTATPFPAGVEGPPGGAKCKDGLDNDCDGSVDLADGSCQMAEVCNGLDDDGDGQIDEDFPLVGTSCSTPANVVGACAATGTYVCAAIDLDDVNDGVTCNAVAKLPTAEGPPGSAACMDGIDNDCDGLTDAADPQCGQSALRVTCALEYTRGKPGSDCNGQHIARWVVSGAGVNRQIIPELIGLDPTFEEVVVQPVGQGNEVHMNSRINPSDWKYMLGNKKRHDLFYPIPLLRVTVRDQGQEAQAFCSNIPFLNVIQPSGQVVTEGAGDVTKVLAAMPLTALNSVFIKVDGVDILAGLGKTPAQCAYPTYCSGQVTIGGEPVDVYDLTIDLAGAIDQHASNTVSFKMSGLPCGGHIVVVDGDPIMSYIDNPTPDCNVDDLRDKGTSASFGLDITAPTPGQVLAAGTVLVTGEICHGLDISGAKVNGGPATLGAQVFIPGDGENSADTYKYPFSASVPETNLLQDVNSGNEPLQRFDPGSNFALAQATDVQGNRAFDSVVFATGNVTPPGTLSFQQAISGGAGGQSGAADVLRQQFEGELRDHIRSLVQEQINAPSIEIENAYIVGLTPTAVQRVFNERCATAATTFANNLKNNLYIGKKVFETSASIDCACDPTVRGFVSQVTVNPNDISCPVVFQNDKFHVDILLPAVTVGINVEGYCIDRGLFDICLSEVTVGGSITTTVSDMKVSFDVTEGQLLKTEAPTPPIRGTCAIGGAPCNNDGNCAAGICDIGDSNTTQSISYDIDCLGEICAWVVDAFAFIINGIAGTQVIQPIAIDFTFTDSFKKDIGAEAPDPIALGEIKVDEQVIAAYDQTTSGALSTVSITPNGLVAGLKGTFATNIVDPQVTPTPGSLLTPAAPPANPQSVVSDGEAFIAMADDSINLMFASMTQAGKLKTGCQPAKDQLGEDLKLGALLPADCESLTGATNPATAAIQGLCHAVKGANCDTLVGVDAVAQTLEQGICHGAKGDNCSTIDGGAVEKATCNATPNLNLQASMPLLFCTKQEVPPRLLLTDDASTSAVETSLRLNDTGVALVVDRDANKALQGGDVSLPITPPCFGAGSTPTADCNLFSTCLDLNFDFRLNLTTCADNKPGFTTEFLGVQVLNREPGLICGGAPVGESESGVLSEAEGSDSVQDELSNNAEDYFPPVCSNGLDLAGLVSCDMHNLITINTDGQPEFKDFLGVACRVIGSN